MKKENAQNETSSRQVTNYKRDYILDASKGIYGRGFAVIIEGHIAMNWLVWHKGTHISPQDKMKVSIEWLKDLTGFLESELQPE